MTSYLIQKCCDMKKNLIIPLLLTIILSCEKESNDDLKSPKSDFVPTDSEKNSTTISENNDAVF